MIHVSCHLDDHVDECRVAKSKRKSETCRSGTGLISLLVCQTTQLQVYHKFSFLLTSGTVRGTRVPWAHAQAHLDSEVERAARTRFSPHQRPTLKKG